MLTPRPEIHRPHKLASNLRRLRSRRDEGSLLSASDPCPTSRAGYRLKNCTLFLKNRPLPTTLFGERDEHAARPCKHNPRRPAHDGVLAVAPSSSVLKSITSCKWSMALPASSAITSSFWQPMKEMTSSVSRNCCTIKKTPLVSWQCAT